MIIYLINFLPLAFQFQFFSKHFKFWWNCNSQFWLQNLSLKRTKSHIITLTMKFCYWTTLEYFLLVMVLHMSHCHLEASWSLPVRQKNFSGNSLLSAFNLLFFSYALEWKNVFKRGPHGFSLPTSFRASCLLWGTVMYQTSVVCGRDASLCCMFSIQR